MGWHIKLPNLVLHKLTHNECTIKQFHGRILIDFFARRLFFFLFNSFYAYKITFWDMQSHEDATDINSIVIDEDYWRVESAAYENPEII